MRKGTHSIPHENRNRPRQTQYNGPFTRPRQQHSLYKCKIRERRNNPSPWHVITPRLCEF